MAAPLRRRATATNRDNRSTAPAISTANGSVLPQDLLYEILERIPAKQLCRLGAVCRSWRSLLSDSSFVAAHSARHGPLIAALKQQPVGVHILDVSGHTVRQMRLQDYPQNHYGTVACTNLDLFCFIGAGRRPHVIDPATGVVSLMPHDSDINHTCPFTVFAIGRASLTGKAKVLAVATRYSTCKVLTLGGADEWRETGCTPISLVNSSGGVALVKGVLYFVGCQYRHDNIVAYDLESETWRADYFHFPVQIRGAGCTLVELNDSLVAVYSRSGDHMCDIFKDLWFLTDSEKFLWSKRYTVAMPYQGFPKPCYASFARPLWVLDDKIVFWVSQYDKTGTVHLLRMYDQRTNTYTDSDEMPGDYFVGVYKGSLLAGYPWSNT
jgi:F-box interacting protein